MHVEIFKWNRSVFSYAVYGVLDEHSASVIAVSTFGVAVDIPRRHELFSAELSPVEYPDNRRYSVSDASPVAFLISYGRDPIFG